jgi:site-specific recombinase XerC
LGLLPDQVCTGEEASVQVLKERDGGIVRRVVLLDDAGDEVGLVTRFLSHLSDSGYSPNTLCAYAYDLRHLVAFLGEHRPSTALEFLAYLRRIPSRRPAQRLGLGVATGDGRLLSVATVARILAATSSFFEWAIASAAPLRARPMSARRRSAPPPPAGERPPPRRA